MPWGEGSEGWGVGTRGPCQGDGGEGGRQSRLRDLVVRLPKAGAAPSGFSVRRNDAVGCAGMTKGGSRFSSFFRYYWAVTIWRAKRGSCGALQLSVHREIKSRLGNHCSNLPHPFRVLACL